MKPETLNLKLKTENRNFILLLLLFVTFRVLVLVAYRPGGLVLDFSDFYWYREFAQLSRQGYIPYRTIWTTYPPLFPVLMLWVWQASVLLPPWNHPNLWYSLGLGGVFLLFETGNFILLYLIARKISPESAFKSAWMYALFFVPVYTVTGWFESYPLFFFLLSLYLLLKKRPYLSALFTGVGFMIKLLPIMLLPVGIQTLARPGEDGQWRISALNLTLNVRRTLLYLAIFGGTVVLIGYPFFRDNPHLALGSFQITGARQSWETVWALLEGNFDYGIIPLDMRNMAWTPADGAGSSLPWGIISVIFGVIGAFLYTRRIEWQRPKVVVGFTALTVSLFFLYSKGYSPQWLGWLLIFIALLIPNLRGGIYAAILSVLNIIEGNIFFAMFPDEHWLLATTVIARTVIIVLLAGEFSLTVWRQLTTPAVIIARRWAPVALTVVLLAGSLLAGTRLKTAYFTSRLNASPYGATIRWLNEQPVKEAILLNSQTAYDWFFPYLHSDHQFYMLDDYADETSSVTAKTTALLNRIAAENDAVWVFDADPAETTPAETALAQWLGTRAPAHQADIDRGRLYLYILK